MKKNTLTKLLLVLMLIYACQAKKNVVSLPKKFNTDSSTNNLINQIKSHQISYQTFAVKAKGDIKFADTEQSLNFNFRIKSGQIIWISASYLGALEVARVLITPDSILIQNKLQSKLIKKPFLFIHQYTSEKIDFKALENIFVGKLSNYNFENPSLLTDTNKYVLSGKVNDLIFKSSLTSSFQLVESLLNNVGKKQNLQIKYGQFISWQNHYIPTQLLINSTVDSKNYQLNLVYDNPELNSNLEFPFNVPKRYSIVN